MLQYHGLGLLGMGLGLLIEQLKLVKVCIYELMHTRKARRIYCTAFLVREKIQKMIFVHVTIVFLFSVN